MTIDLSKQQLLDADWKALEQINFTGNLAWDPNAFNSIFHYRTNERNCFRFFTRNCVSIVNLFLF